MIELETACKNIIDKAILNDKVKYEHHIQKETFDNPGENWIELNSQSFEEYLIKDYGEDVGTVLTTIDDHIDIDEYLTNTLLHN